MNEGSNGNNGGQDDSETIERKQRLRALMFKVRNEAVEDAASLIPDLIEALADVDPSEYSQSEAKEWAEAYADVLERERRTSTDPAEKADAEVWRHALDQSKLGDWGPMRRRFAEEVELFQDDADGHAPNTPEWEREQRAAHAMQNLLDALPEDA